MSILNVFLVWLPNFFFKPSVTTPAARVTIGLIIHLIFHIRCTYTHKLPYFIFFSASFRVTFLSARIATSISVFVFTFFFKIMISALSICYYSSLSLSLSVPLHSTTLSHCVCPSDAHTSALHIQHAAMHQHCRVPLGTHSLPNFAIVRPVTQSTVSSCCLYNRHILSVSPFNVLFLKLSALLGIESCLCCTLFLPMGGGNYMMRSLISCNPHEILFGLSNRE